MECHDCLRQVTCDRYQWGSPKRILFRPTFFLQWPNYLDRKKSLKKERTVFHSLQHVTCRALTADWCVFWMGQNESKPVVQRESYIAKEPFPFNDLHQDLHFLIFALFDFKVYQHHNRYSPLIILLITCLQTLFLFRAVCKLWQGEILMLLPSMDVDVLKLFKPQFLKDVCSSLPSTGAFLTFTRLTHYRQCNFTSNTTKQCPSSTLPPL